MSTPTDGSLSLSRLWINRKKKITAVDPQKAKPGQGSSTPALPKVKKTAIVLSDEQKKVLEMVVDKGMNIFFTGSAGTFPLLVLFFARSLGWLD